MNIDRSKILAAKKKPVDIIAESYNSLGNTPTVVECANFLQSFKSQPLNYISENFNMILTLPLDTTNVAKSMLESYKFDENDLNRCKYIIESHINDDNDYVVDLNSLLSIIENKLSYMESMDYLLEETNFIFTSNEMKEVFTEAYTGISAELDFLTRNVNSDPVVISDYEELVRRIKMDDSGKYFSEYPNILRSNTEFIKAHRQEPVTQVANLITDLPVIMANKMTSRKYSAKELIAFKNTLIVELQYLTKALGNSDFNKYRLTRMCIQKFNSAISVIDNALKSYKVIEGIVDMQPDIIIEDKPASEIYGAQSKLNLELSNIIFSEKDITFKDIEKITRLENYINTNFEVIEEDVVGKAAKVQSIVRKGTNKISRPGGSKLKRGAVAIKKTTDPFFNMLTKTINDIKKMDKAQRRERIVTGGFANKLKNLLRNAIKAIIAGGIAKAAVPALGYIGPVLTVITLLGTIALDKNYDKKERRKILNELETELTIVTEKIEDARGADDKEKKYQLMRIKQKLEREIERIKRGLDE